MLDTLRRLKSPPSAPLWLAKCRSAPSGCTTSDDRLGAHRSGRAKSVAAIAFFNAAYRAEESGLKQAHELAGVVERWDPELAECLRLYGDEEGWHRELLTEFLAYLGGQVKPMGKVTGTFYRLYGRAERMETIVLTNLMFETIGSTTYRLRSAARRTPRCATC